MRFRSMQVAAIAVAVSGLGVFGGVAKADHSLCHTLIGNCSFVQFDPPQERQEMWASAVEEGTTITVQAWEALPGSPYRVLPYQWFEVWIGSSDGTVHHVTGRPDVFTVDPLLSSSRLEASFEVDGSAYELIVELEGQESIQYATSEDALLLYRSAVGKVSLFRDSQGTVDLPAEGQLGRLVVSARFGLGGGGCLGPIC